MSPVEVCRWAEQNLLCTLPAVWPLLTCPNRHQFNVVRSRFVLYRSGAAMDPELQGQHMLSCIWHHSLPPGSSGAECACCSPHIQQTELATFQGDSGLEFRLFSSPSSTVPQRALIKARRELKKLQEAQSCGKAGEDVVSLSACN